MTGMLNGLDIINTIWKSDSLFTTLLFSILTPLLYQTSSDVFHSTRCDNRYLPTHDFKAALKPIQYFQAARADNFPAGTDQAWQIISQNNNLPPSSLTDLGNGGTLMIWQMQMLSLSSKTEIEALVERQWNLYLQIRSSPLFFSTAPDLIRGNTLWKSVCFVANSGYIQRAAKSTVN